MGRTRRGCAPNLNGERARRFCPAPAILMSSQGGVGQIPGAFAPNIAWTLSFHAREIAQGVVMASAVRESGQDPPHEQLVMLVRNAAQSCISD